MDNKSVFVEDEGRSSVEQSLKKNRPGVLGPSIQYDMFLHHGKRTAFVLLLKEVVSSTPNATNTELVFDARATATRIQDT